MASKRVAVDTEPKTSTKAGPDLCVPKPKRKKLGRCSCEGRCESRKCGCSRNGQICGEHCKCIAWCEGWSYWVENRSGCKNPFNVLMKYGIDWKAAAKNRCLMDHIFKYEDIRGHAETSIELDCCGGIYYVKIKDLIPGPVECRDCGAEWSYSWCHKELFQTVGLKHCKKCRQCADFMDSHCNKCNKCTPRPCPCQPEGSTNWSSDVTSQRSQT